MLLKNSFNKIFKILFFIFVSCLLVAIYYIFCITNAEIKYDKIILSAAKRHNIDPNLIKAVIWQESSFRPNIVGSKNERGLMQIMEKHAVQDWVNYRKCEMPLSGLLYSPEINIEIGAWYLARCKSHWVKSKNSIAIALAEYNAGYKKAKEWAVDGEDKNFVDVISFPSTKKYVKSILYKYEKYKSSNLKISD